MDSTISKPPLYNTLPNAAAAREPGTRGGARYWPELLFFTILIFAMHLTMGIKGNIIAGNFLDTDVYSWLNRVTLLHEHGDWFDKSLPQVNPPEGHTQHWSRAFDALLYAGAAAGSPLVGFRAALEYWAVWVSPFLQALTLITLLVLLRPMFPQNKEALPIVAFLFVGHNALLQSFAVGRADHQSLLLFCAALTLGCAARMLLKDAPRFWCYAAGFACAFGVWVSVEFMLVIGILQVAFGLFWLLETGSHAQTMARFSLGLLGFGSLAMLAHNGPEHLNNLATDEISVLYWILFAGSAAFWSLAQTLTARGWVGTWQRKCSFAVAGGATLAMTVYAIMPNVLSGPLGELDSLYERVRLSQITEIQPLVSRADLTQGNWDWLFARTIPWLGLLIPASIAGYFAARSYLSRQHTPLSRTGTLIAIGLLIFVPLACYQVRWMGYAALLMVPAAAWTLLQLLDRISTSLTAKAAEVARFATILLVALGFNATLPLAGASHEHALLRGKSGSTLAEVAEHLGNPKVFGTQPLSIVAFVDYGPEIIYRTRRHGVFAMPNHRPQPGFIASYAAMSSPTDAKAKQILQALNADLVLVRDHPAELAFYRNAAGMETFHARLVAGDAPQWLIEQPLSDGPESGFRLYRMPGR
jgi:hypothetical protein